MKNSEEFLKCQENGTSAEKMDKTKRARGVGKSKTEDGKVESNDSPVILYKESKNSV